MMHLVIKLLVSTATGHVDLPKFKATVGATNVSYKHRVSIALLKRERSWALHLVVGRLVGQEQTSTAQLMTDL